MNYKQRKPCPKCGKGKLAERVSRPGLVKAVLFWLPLKRYICHICNKKTYIFGSVWIKN